MLSPDGIESLVKRLLHQLPSDAELVPRSVTVERSPSYSREAAVLKSDLVK